MKRFLLSLFAVAFLIIPSAEAKRRWTPKAVSSSGNVATFGSFVTDAPTGTGTTVSAPTIAVPANSLVVAFIAGTTVPTGITDGTNSMTFLRRITLTDPYYIDVWYKENATANASATFVGNFTGTTAFRNISVITFTGVATSSSVDGSASNSAGDNSVAASATNRTSQNITTTNGNDLLLGYWLNYNILPTNSAASGWTLRSTGGAQAVGISSRMATSTGSYPAADFGTVGTTDQYLSFIVAFKVP